jgi:hypothetical protein
MGRGQPMNTPLRDELGKIIKPWTAEMTPDITDEILVFIASKMPEKDNEMEGAGASRDPDIMHAIGFEVGWNAYHDSVKSILKGGTDNGS